MVIYILFLIVHSFVCVIKYSLDTINIMDFHFRYFLNIKFGQVLNINVPPKFKSKNQKSSVLLLKLHSLEYSTNCLEILFNMCYNHQTCECCDFQDLTINLLHFFSDTTVHSMSRLVFQIPVNIFRRKIKLF